MKRKILYLFLLFAIHVFSQNTLKSDSLTFHYPVNEFQLPKKTIKKLDSLLVLKDTSLQYNIHIISSADNSGTDIYNKKLVQKRLNFIKNIVEKHTIKATYKLTNLGKTGKRNDYKNRKSILIIKPADTSPFYNVKNLKVGSKFALKDINFYISSTKLYPKSKKVIIEFANFLNKNPNIEIEIIGHVCCGYAKPKLKPKNLPENDLSTRRAHSIYNYLAYKGVSKKRMKYVGYGFQQPLIYPEKNHLDQNKNKRVEIKITKM